MPKYVYTFEGKFSYDWKNLLKLIYDKYKQYKEEFIVPIYNESQMDYQSPGEIKVHLKIGDHFKECLGIILRHSEV